MSINCWSFCLAGMLLSTGLQAKEQFRVSLGTDFLSGDYGGSTTTEITAVTLTGRYRKDRWILQASLPYLYIQDGGYTVDGVPVAGSASTEQGFGDLIISASYLGFYDRESGAGLSTKVKIKLPTADKDKGLGTGETDTSVQADPFWVIDSTTIFSTLGYKMYGDTATRDYNDVFYFTLGGMYKIDDSFSLGVGGTYRQKVLDTSENKQEVFVFANKKIDQGNSLDLHVSAGLSDASPDWALGFSIKHNY